MALAVLLLLCVVVNLCVTFFLLGRVREYLGKVNALETRLGADVAASVAAADDVPVDADIVIPRGPDVSDSAPDGLASVLADATPEDLAQAEAILKALGMDVSGK